MKLFSATLFFMGFVGLCCMHKLDAAVTHEKIVGCVLDKEEYKLKENDSTRCFALCEAKLKGKDIQSATAQKDVEACKSYNKRTKFGFPVKREVLCTCEYTDK